MKRILHLDDDEEIIFIVQHVLGKKYILRSLTHPPTIDTEIADFRPDLVITDNFSSLMEEGSMLLQYAEESGTPVILFSALPDVAERASQLGLEGYIEKPASINHIREYVERMIKS